MKRLAIRSGAQRDIAEAHAWYESQRVGLGAEFMSALEDALDAIAANAERFAIMHADLRRALLKRFPYAVFYRTHPQGVIIVAVLHCARDRDALDQR